MDSLWLRVLRLQCKPTDDKPSCMCAKFDHIDWSWWIGARYHIENLFTAHISIGRRLLCEWMPESNFRIPPSQLGLLRFNLATTSPVNRLGCPLSSLQLQVQVQSVWVSINNSIHSVQCRRARRLQSRVSLTRLVTLVVSYCWSLLRTAVSHSQSDAWSHSLIYDLVWLWLCDWNQIK